MNRGIIVLLLGIAAGTATYVLSVRAHQPFDPNSLDGQLAWMKSELNLSDEQFERIRELHEASSPRLRALAAQVAQMQQEFAAFETTRRTSDRVDFIEFAHFVEVRRDINQQCLDSTHELILASAKAMTPGQREHYFGIVARADPQTLPATY